MCTPPTMAASFDESRMGPYLRDTLILDKLHTPAEAIIEIYRRMRPGDPPTAQTATNFCNNLFFNPDRYDLSKVGRLKLNHRFKFNVPHFGQVVSIPSEACPCGTRRYHWTCGCPQYRGS